MASDTPIKIKKAVNAVMNKAKRKGRTSKQSATLETMVELRKSGIDALKIPPAFMWNAVQHMVKKEVTNQLNRSIANGVSLMSLPANTQEDIQFLANLKSMKAWIALEEGPGAEHVFAPVAGIPDLVRHLELIRKKERQTAEVADALEAVIRHMRQKGMKNLLNGEDDD
jgi:hypothetical protein